MVPESLVVPLPGTDRLGGVRIFVEAARTLNFTAAAARLGVTKSGVGKSIAQLEARLGTKLFYRSTRRLSLTADGEAYLASCTLALDALDEAEAALSSTQLVPRGRLRVDLPVAFGRKVVLPVLAGIAQAHPELSLVLSFTDRLVDPVEAGIDLLIRFGELKSSTGLVARKLTEQRRVMVAAPRYLARFGAPSAPNELVRHRCIVALRGEGPPGWIVTDADGRATRIAPPPTHEIGDGDAVVEAAIAGLGIAQMPSSLVRVPIADGRLMPVLDANPGSFVPVHAVWPGTRHLLPKVRVIVDELVRRAAAGALD